MFKFEEIEINPEYDERVREILISHKDEIESLLNDESKFLGEGRTANVRFLRSNEQVCLKIYKEEREIPPDVFFVAPEKEKDFLNALDGLDSEVRVPKIYARYTKSSEDKSFLLMEALPAVSVDDLLQGRVEIPPNFDLGKFSKVLLDFVNKMHSLNIYHRDLHEGNIMINKETGEIYVIDFGAATYFYGEPEPGEDGPYHVTQNGQKTKLNSDEVTVKLLVRKLAALLT